MGERCSQLLFLFLFLEGAQLLFVYNWIYRSSCEKFDFQFHILLFMSHYFLRLHCARGRLNTLQKNMWPFLIFVLFLSTRKYNLLYFSFICNSGESLKTRKGDCSTCEGRAKTRIDRAIKGILKFNNGLATSSRVKLSMTLSILSVLKTKVNDLRFKKR